MRTTLIIAGLTLPLMACQSYDPKRVEQDFGNSVRQMIAEQKYNEQNASSPALGGPDRMDGTTAVTTLEQYQQAAKKTQAGATNLEPGVQ